MDVKKLLYFVHVAELGSFSKASSVLGIAQPALSRHVRDLEDELQSRLLYRNGRGVSVTEVGKELLERGKPLLAHLDQLKCDIVAMTREPTGSVTLGVPPTVSQMLVSPLLARFAKIYPKVSLEVVEGFSGHVYEWLVNGRLDVAVIYNAPRTRNLEADRLLVEDLFLVCPPGAPAGTRDRISLRRIEGLPLILPRRPHGLRLLIDAAASECGINLTISHQIDALNVIKDLVTSGSGYTILPSAPVYRELRAGQLVLRKLIDPALTRTLLLVSTTQRPLSFAARVVASAIKDETRRLVSSGEWSGSV
ncbi:MAG: LysR family transcriptional regulator [Gammaproteobacteria bacterium]|nr:LysR family transcriptional regulator [Gammaproteobacteria bacterium]